MGHFLYNFVTKGKSLGLVRTANRVRARVGFRVRITDQVSGLLIWKLSPIFSPGIEEFDALREQPAMINQAVRDMHRRTLLCVERNKGHVDGRGA